MTPTFPKMIPRWRRFLLLCALLGGTVVSAHAQRDAPRAEQELGAAVQLYEQHLYPQAASALEAFRNAHPAHAAAPQSLYLEAQSTLAQGNDAETRRLLNRLQHEYPFHPRAQAAKLRLAQYYADQGDPDRAKTQLRAIAEDPYSAEEGARALYLLARTEQEQDNLDAALVHFEQVYRRYPDAELAPAALYAEGVTHVQRERYDHATAAFEQLGEQYPSSGFAQNLGTILGEVYYRLEQYDVAVKELQQRLPGLADAERTRALFLLGESYNQLGQLEAARTQYQQVLEEAPTGSYAAPARFGLAWQHYQSEQYEKAASAFAEVRSTDAPLATRATYYEAVNRALLGNRDRAFQLYQRVLKEAEDDRLRTEARYEIGLLRYQQEQYEAAAEALRPLTQGTDSENRLGDAYYWLGNAYLAGDQLDRALEAYSGAINRGTASASVRIEVRFQKAWTLYQNGRYAEAGSDFRSLAEQNPDTDRGQDALFWGADTYYQQEEYARARPLLRRYLTSAPEGMRRSRAQYALAWTHFKERQFEQAARQFRQFLSTYESPSNSTVPYRQDAQLRLADCYFALKRYEDAISVYRRAGGDGAEYALYQTGRALYFADRSDAALDRLRRLVERFPDSPWRPNAWYRIGDIHFQQQRYEEARSAFQNLIDTYPDYNQTPRAQYALGDTYYNAGEMEQAVEAYRTVLETYPESSSADEAASSLFFALNAAGQQDRADKLIASIAETNPDASLGDRLRYQRARAAFQRGDSKRALRLFREFVRTTSASSFLPGAYYHLGLLHADLDQNTEAENYLGQLVDQYDDSEYFAEGSLRLGDIYLDQETYEEALDAYRAAAKYDQTPDALRAQARYGQGKALLQLNRTDEADSLLSKIIESDSGGPLQDAARLGLGRVREQQKQMDDAQALYRRVAESSDSETGAEALYRLGRTLRTQGEAQAAIRELERMPSLFAGYPEWEARALLEQARSYRALDQTGQAVQLYEQVQNRYSGTPFAETADEERQSLESGS
jgi:TolA-binding protein